jgi:4-hydroxymandelate oxidase
VTVLAPPTGLPTRAPVCLDDVEAAARAVLSPEVCDFVAGGSGAELTLRANRTAFDRVQVVPRVLAGLGTCDPSSRIVGSQVSLPVCVAPMAYQRLLHPDGELATADAAREAGVVFVAAMLSSFTIEEIVKCGAETWLQLYWLRERDLMRELVCRAEDAGVRALMLTVDVPRMGRRLRDMRWGFALPEGIVAANLPAASTAQARSRHADTSALIVHTAAAFDPSLSLADVAWLRGRTQLPIVLKGVLHPQDAVRAAELGVDAVVVSNHGGRQLDGALPSITALPGVQEAVAGRCEVLLDSGVRGGLDVFKALARGAGAALVGRPALWGLAAGGRAGVALVLSLLRTELEDAMTLAGCPDLAAAAATTTVIGPPDTPHCACGEWSLP